MVLSKTSAAFTLLQANMKQLGVLLLVIAISGSISHAQDTSCLNQLAPCIQYLNSTSTPSSSCCNPLKSVIKSNPACLCNLLSSSAKSQASVNVAQATLLPQKCGENVSPSNCSTLTKTSTTQTNSAERNLTSKISAMVAFSAAIFLALGSL